MKTLLVVITITYAETVKIVPWKYSSIISDQDCVYLLEAFNKIGCHNAARRLQGLFVLVSTYVVRFSIEWISFVFKNINEHTQDENYDGRKRPYTIIKYHHTMSSTPSLSVLFAIQATHADDHYSAKTPNSLPHHQQHCQHSTLYIYT
jgi:hypothetical protein